MLLRPFEDERDRLEPSVRVRRKPALRVDPILRECDEWISAFGILGKERDAVPHQIGRTFSLRVFNSHDRFSSTVCVGYGAGMGLNRRSCIVDATLSMPASPNVSVSRLVWTE